MLCMRGSLMVLYGPQAPLDVPPDINKRETGKLDTMRALIEKKGEGKWMNKQHLHR